MRPFIWITTAALALTCASAGWSQTNPAATTPASQPAASAPIDDARWQPLLKRLGDADFAVREAAQKELDKVTWRDLAALKQLADGTTDPEVKSRLTGRMDAIKVDLAVNPPPLTLELKDAALNQVATDLSGAMGVRLDAWPGSNQRDFFSIKVVDKPFWEIFLELSRQHPLMLQNYSNKPRLMESSPGWRNATIVGPVAIFPDSITRQRVGHLQNDKEQMFTPETYTLSLVAAVDPRVRIIRNASPIFTSIEDELGNSLYLRDGITFSGGAGNGPNIESISVALKLLEKHGMKIASAKGKIQYVVQTGETVVEVANPEQKVGQDIQLPTGAVRLTQFTVRPEGGINFNLSSPNGGIRVGNQEPEAVTVQVLDGAGQSIFTTTFSGGGMGAGLGGNYTGPFKLRFSVPTGTKEVAVPFELKDIPLP